MQASYQMIEILDYRDKTAFIVSITDDLNYQIIPSVMCFPKTGMFRDWMPEDASFGEKHRTDLVCD